MALIIDTTARTIAFNDGDIALGVGSSAGGNGVAFGKSATTAGNYGVAIGWLASIGGGGSNAIGYTASASTNSSAMGNGAAATNYSVSIGGGNTSSNSSSVTVGYGASSNNAGVAIGASASSDGGTALGSGASTNTKNSSVAIGTNSKAQRYRELVKSADGAATTLQSFSMVNWYKDTANATPVEILLGGTAAQYCGLLNNSAFNFVLQVTAATTAGSDCSFWTISGGIKRGANAASTALVGTPNIQMTGQDVGAAAWAIAVSADTTNGSLKLVVTGASAATVRWNVTGTLSEVRF